MERLGSFSLALPGETRFGWGCLAELPERLAPFGRCIGVARGAATEHRDWYRRLRAQLTETGWSVVELPPQAREPEPEDVDAAVACLRAARAQVVVAIGGGSVIDLGKAAAALATQDAGILTRAYLEGVGNGATLQADPLPFIAVPTTAGTGAEATKNAVLSSSREGFKKSLRDQRMLARLALVDPQLCEGLPPHLTAASGLDALTQLIEAYTTLRAQPVTDALALCGIEAARALPTAVADGTRRDAREQMSLAAYLSGVCLANAGLGAAHGIAAALGSVAPIAHGLACALALPWVMAANLPVVEARYAQVTTILTGQSAPADAAIPYVWQLLADLGIPRVADLPLLAPAFTDEQLPQLAARCHGNSLQGNPRPLDDDALCGILRAMRDAEAPYSAGVGGSE